MAGNQLGSRPSGLVARPCGAFIEEPGRPSSGILCMCVLGWVALEEQFWACAGKDHSCSWPPHILP